MNVKRFLLLSSLCGVMAASAAHADTISTYTLSVNGCSSGCGTGPYGTVTVDTASSGLSATVTVSLNSNVNFAGTGAGNSLAFDLAGSPAVTFSGVSSGFAPVAGPVSASTFGSFDYAVSCWDHVVAGGACHGSTGPKSLSFTISSSSPITFVKNAGGFFFASDVAVTTDGVVATGNVGDRDPGTPTTPTPEPSSLMLLGTGVMGLASFVRRRMA